MQSVARLEAQIEKELKELNRIQGVLEDLGAEKKLKNQNKENFEQIKHQVVQQESKNKCIMKTQKTPTFEASRKASRTPEPKVSDNNLKITKKAVLEPQTISKPRPLGVKVQNDQPKLEKVTPKKVEVLKPQEKRVHQRPIQKKESLKSDDFIYLESFKESMDERKPGITEHKKPNKLFNDILEMNESEDQRASRTSHSKSRIEESSSKQKPSISLADLLEDDEFKVRRVKRNVQTKSKEASRTPEKIKSKEKGVIDLGHEQLEKMYHQFREARKKAKTFEERVNLMVLEKESQEMLLKMIKQAKESEQEAQALRECTFSPNLTADQRSKTPKSSKQGRLNQTIYERNIEWDVHRQNKLEDERENLKRIPKECTFKPTINQFNKEKVTHLPRELQKSGYMKDALACHYYRMGKARSKSPTQNQTSKEQTAGQRDTSTSRALDRSIIDKIHKVRHSHYDEHYRMRTPEHDYDHSDRHGSVEKNRDRHKQLLIRELDHDRRAIRGQLMAMEFESNESSNY